MYHQKCWWMKKPNKQNPCLDHYGSGRDFLLFKVRRFERYENIQARSLIFQQDEPELMDGLFFYHENRGSAKPAGSKWPAGRSG